MSFSPPAAPLMLARVEWFPTSIRLAGFESDLANYDNCSPRRWKEDYSRSAMAEWVVSWIRAFGMVNAAPGFVALAPVIDGFTELMVDLFGEDAALCPRAVAGMAELALDSPVIVEGEVEIREVT